MIINRALRKQYNPDLSAHIAECEANYARLQKLLPGEHDLGEQKVGTQNHCFEFIIPTCCEHNEVDADGSNIKVQLEIIESFKYTSTIRVKEFYPSAQQGLDWLCPLELLVRVYHDAKVAEVISYQQTSGFKSLHPYPNKAMFSRNEKIRLNQFLGECLSHCLSHGMVKQVVWEY